MMMMKTSYWVRVNNPIIGCYNYLVSLRDGLNHYIVIGFATLLNLMKMMMTSYWVRVFV